MKKTTAAFILFFMTTILFAQEKYDDKDNLFYATLADAQNHNPIPGLYSKTEFDPYDEFDITYANGETKKNVKCKSKEWPSEYFTNRGMLIRVIEGKAYVCLSLGRMNFYSAFHDGKKFTQEGNTGALKKWDPKYFESLLQQHDLLLRYQMEKPHREISDTVSGYGSKIMGWQVKFMMLLNEKL
ncbi:hypothetical protein [Flavobacterium silvaticum]|uniref:Uncharacterized protein n=1 Tax=Flavobacterium silvaticum TaxID=1852020 RepID=A0A972FW58_9FLAO|nr:hypothetical protein [Flavobacterium silvaticum]NMH28730.1 hypothetical protein [Flavobacterium silvaticum]